jgi:Arm DNA-binding domain
MARKSKTPEPERNTFNRILADQVFTPEMFEEGVKTLKALKVKESNNAKITLSDPMTTGLQAIIRPSGAVSFHVHYHCNGQRPLLKLGNHPDMTIAQARELTKTVIALGNLGIDPQEGLHERLIRELQAKGIKWRP